jgi:spore maturation protein CgeB
MNGRLSFRFFAHSWISDWNHGNAHFLRGLASALVRLGHEVHCYEESNGWSVQNLKTESQEVAFETLVGFREWFPELDVRFYSYSSAQSLTAYLTRELRDADVVVIHEWNSPEVIQAILALKSRFHYKALFHDTHHRAYTSPQEILKSPLSEFDGVLAFGDAIRRIYTDGFGVKRVWTLHEAADVDRCYPLDASKDTDVVWIGNWGDDERTQELEEFLMAPARALRAYKFAVHGVRYPVEARKRLASSRIEYRGYLPNLHAAQMYARSKLSVHIPRRFYSNGLSGVPTIRVFEALAAGSPLVCSPWSDTEGLFRPGQDFICVRDGQAMAAELKRLLNDESARDQLAASGRQTILERHTCAHRATQLVDICHQLEN